MPDIVGKAIIVIEVSKAGIRTHTQVGPGVQYSHLITGIELEKHNILDAMRGKGRPENNPTFNVRDLNSESGIN